MVKRTSLNLDLDLLNDAKEVLETRETTETIHRALAEVVRQARLRSLSARRFDMTNEELERLRTPDVEVQPLLPER
jgi:Bacterial antitoxin of type II TA system, VapB